MNIRTIRIELQKIALDIELYEKETTVPEPILTKLDNLVRDLRLFLRKK